MAEDDHIKAMASVANEGVVDSMTNLHIFHLRCKHPIEVKIASALHIEKPADEVTRNLALHNLQHINVSQRQASFATFTTRTQHSTSELVYNIAIVS